ncbi:hypothetical protein G6F42_021149 [Rhizopus arrhizus]|nr:hypothetical protein G6F42_021149 [Rhizopus arrhizus]
MCCQRATHAVNRSHGLYLPYQHNPSTTPERTISRYAVSFLGSFEDVTVNRKGVRAVDLNDCLLHLVPSLFASQLQSSAAKKAVSKLARGCAISLLCWDLSSELLDEMDTCFESFFTYCNSQIALKKLSSTVFRPVMHALVHFSKTVAKMGPINASSCRSQERVIQKFKNLMTSKINSQAQPSNLVEQQAIRSLLWHDAVDLEHEANILHPVGFDASTWEQHSGPEELPRQLWIPLRTFIISNDNNTCVEDLPACIVQRALIKFYRRYFSAANLDVQGELYFQVSYRAWLDYKFVITSTAYARSNREYRRAGYYVLFRSPYLNSLGETQLVGWFVGKVLFYMKHIFDGQTFFLAMVKNVFKSHSLTDCCRTIPIVEEGTIPKYAVVSLDNCIMRELTVVYV